MSPVLNALNLIDQFRNAIAEMLIAATLQIADDFSTIILGN